MKKYFLFASLLFAWTLTSCDSDDSSDIEPDVPFYQNLGVSYDVTNNKTNVGANFNKQAFLQRTHFCTAQRQGCLTGQ